MRARQKTARSPTREIVLAIILITVILGGAAWIINGFISRKTEKEKGKPPIYLHCTECQQVYRPEERLGGKHPRKCDKCGAKAAWYAQQCLDCGAIFPLKPRTDFQGNPLPGPPFCPECGSRRYVFYGPDAELQKQGKQVDD